MKHTGKTFKGQALRLDGTEFHGCTLDDCDLVYAGGLPPSIVDCTVRNCRFTFEGPALNTLILLKGMASPGSAFQDFVRDLLPVAPRPAH